MNELQTQINNLSQEYNYAASILALASQAAQLGKEDKTKQLIDLFKQEVKEFSDAINSTV
jgi:hypothetical protein